MNYLKTGSPFKAGDDKEETLSLALFLDLLRLIATIPLRQGFAGQAKECLFWTARQR